MKTKFDKAKAVAKSVAQMIVVAPFLLVMTAVVPFSFAEPVQAWCVRVIHKIDGK
jgi:hypothetical protein